MALLKNYKTYVLIDFYNEVYGFVNSASDLDKFYEDRAINIASIPRDTDGTLLDTFLVNIKTKQEVPIKFSSGNTLCI